MAGSVKVATIAMIARAQTTSSKVKPSWLLIAVSFWRRRARPFQSTDPRALRRRSQRARFRLASGKRRSVPMDLRELCHLSDKGHSKQVRLSPGVEPERRDPQRSRDIDRYPKNTNQVQNQGSEFEFSPS